MILDSKRPLAGPVSRLWMAAFALLLLPAVVGLSLVTLRPLAAGAVLRPHLPPGAGTVGTMVEMKHLAATPVGMRVRAHARLVESDGKRYLFAVEAWDEQDKIAEGRHERFVVPDLEKFLARAMKKRPA